MASASRPPSTPGGPHQASPESPAPQDEPTRPAGEALEVTANDLAALDQLARVERMGGIGLGVVALVALRAAQGTYAGHLRTPSILPFVLLLAGIVVGVYAVWTQANPDGIGQTLLRVDPEGEIAAGRELAVTVLLRPRKRLDLDPLKVRLVAQGADVGLTKGEIVHESQRLVGERRAIEAGRAVRFEMRILVPDDAPTSAPGKPVKWRVEVTSGEPAAFSIARSIRVRSGANAAAPRA
jgi:hypothetical protein